MLSLSLFDFVTLLYLTLCIVCTRVRVVCVCYIDFAECDLIRIGKQFPMQNQGGVAPDLVFMQIPMINLVA